MRELILSARLRSAADMLEPDRCVVDVGTDHAFLPIFLAQNGIARRITATELRPQPLRRAENNLKRFGLLQKVRLVLCDGLQGIDPEDAEEIVIAGMGGETIASILAAAPWTGMRDRNLILQPATSAEELRRFLCEHGYRIVSERLTEDAGRLYLLIRARGGETEKAAPAQFYTGLRLQDDPLYGLYLAALTKRIRSALGKMRHSSKPEDVPRVKLFEEVLRQAEAESARWESRCTENE